jgi:RNA polymerase sigma-70 factor (family 1)
MNIGPADNERELLSRIGKGDTAAFKVIYDRYWRTVYHTALRFLKSPARAQDIVQEVFLKLWSKGGSLQDIENLEPFLFIMARNEVLMALRNKFQPVQLHAHFTDVLQGDLLPPDRAYCLKQSEALIREAIEQLPPRQKLIFRLTRQEGLSHEEIAGQLGIDKRTISNHATKALNAIRVHLKYHSDLTILLLWMMKIIFF